MQNHELDALKKLVMELDLNEEFDNLDAEMCSACCNVGGGGNVGC